MNATLHLRRSLGALAAFAALGLAPSLHADDRDVLRDSATRPYMFVLLDTSGSMNAPVSERSKLMRSEAGALFGAILAGRGEDVTLVAYATDPAVLGRPNPGASPLTVVKRVLSANTNGWGTETAKALRATYGGHDQVFVFDGVKEPEEYGAQQPYWNRIDPDYTTTTTSTTSTTTTTTTVPPTDSTTTTPPTTTSVTTTPPATSTTTTTTSSTTTTTVAPTAPISVPPSAPASAPLAAPST